MQPPSPANPPASPQPQNQTHPHTAKDRPKDVNVVERAGWNADRDTGGGLATLVRPDAGAGAASGKGGPSGGSYRLMLLAAHTEGRVVTGICRVVQGVDEAHARSCFSTSKQLGMALVVSCLKEHAEHYRQQLYLYGLKTAIEPDASTA